MRIIPFIVLLSISAFPQCDANEDGNLDILDIIDQVNCILDGCWGSDGELNEINDYWMTDSIYADISIGGFPIQGLSMSCGDEEMGNPTVMNFNEDGYAYVYPLDSPDYCGHDAVNLPDTFGSSDPYTVNGDSLSISTYNEYGEAELLAFVYEIDGENLTLSSTQSFDDIMPGAVGTTIIYLHRVTILNNHSVSNRNSNSNLYRGSLYREYTDKLLLKLYQGAIKK